MLLEQNRNVDEASNKFSLVLPQHRKNYRARELVRQPQDQQINQKLTINTTFQDQPINQQQEAKLTVRERERELQNRVVASTHFLLSAISKSNVSNGSPNLRHFIFGQVLLLFILFYCHVNPSKLLRMNEARNLV